MHPSLQVSRWLLGREIRYLHERFRAARQEGDMMVDLESIYADLCEYLGGERVRLNEPRAPQDPIDVPMVEAGDEGENGESGEEEQGEDIPPGEGDDPNVEDPDGDELVNTALNGIPLNGEMVDRTDVHPEVHPGPTDPENEENISDDRMGAESADILTQ